MDTKQMFHVKCFSSKGVCYECYCENKFDAIVLANKLTEIYSHRSNVRNTEEDAHFYDVFPALDMEEVI